MGQSVKGDFASKPFGLFWRSSTHFILTTVIIGLFSETFLYGLIVPVLPFILQSRLGVPHDDLQKWSSVLLAAFAGSTVIFAPLSGVIADRSKSRKAPFMYGLAMLIVVCILDTAISEQIATNRVREHCCFSQVAPSMP
jgi:MFS family permease